MSSLPRLRVLVAAAVALGGGLGACGDDGRGTAADDPARFADESLDAVDDRARSDDAVTTTAPPTSLDPTDIPGAPVNQFELDIGDCFDRLEDLQDGRPVVITTRLDCDEPHHMEIFHRTLYPAEHPSVHPGDTVMRDYALQACYREFPGWVGQEYELSELDIGVIVPPRENFEDDRARYRGIHCWVERVDGEAMTGSSRGSGW
jgi:hypothetical protein